MARWAGIWREGLAGPWPLPSSRPGGIAGKGLGAGGGCLRRPEVSCSVSREHQLLPSLGPGALGPLAATPSPSPLRLRLCPGKMLEGLSAGRDESPSSDWPLRHTGHSFQPRVGIFFLVLDWLCGFYKSSSFISFQALVFQQGESPGRELSHWGGVGVGASEAWLGLGEAGNGRSELSAENVDVSPLGHGGWSGGGGGAGSRCHWMSVPGSPGRTELVL